MASAMLRELSIRNLAVVEEARVPFAPGLNVLTGETGAGKSIVVDALLLVTGARAQLDWIRTGAETALVEAVFDHCRKKNMGKVVFRTRADNERMKSVLHRVGFVPTQIDYSDFRDVAGVKVPFKRVVSQTFMQMTVELTDVQPNAAIDAARFARPAPAPRPAG